MVTYIGTMRLSADLTPENVLCDDAEMFTSEMHDPCARTTLPARDNKTETPSKGLRCGAGQTPSEG